MTFTVRSGPWSPTQIEAFLTEAVIPVRLATVGRRGPLVQSVWFRYEDASLWCATQADSVLATRLRRDAHVGWEVAGDLPPYRGVRGTGRAELVKDAEPVLRQLIERYGQGDTPLADWLLARVESELAVRITDLRISSWDYAGRMANDA